MTQTPYEQGLAHYQAGDYQTGLVSFTEAINQNYQPLDAAYYERSKCYEALGQIDAAKADLAHMLTLSIDETRRKQITDLITLLDEAEVNPLPPTDKMPDSFKVEENETGLTIMITKYSKSTAVMGAVMSMVILYGLAWASLWLVNYYIPCLIVVLLGLAYGSYIILDGEDDQIVITVNDTELKVNRTPSYKYKPVEVPRATIGQLICQREFKFTEYKPSYTLMTDNQTMLINLSEYDHIRYIQWQLRSHLKLSDTPQPHEYVPAKKIEKVHNYKPFRRWGWADVVNYIFMTFYIMALGAFAIRLMFILIPQVEHFYSDGEYIPLIGGGIIDIALILLFLSVVFESVKTIWQVRQIVADGRVAQGIVVGKHDFISNKNHIYNVYYRYYDYETIINLRDLFDRVNVGDTIKVAYFPDKPHISRPYY